MGTSGGQVIRRQGNLPTATTSFVGRRRELSAAKRGLSQVRLLTLTGVGGVGKTRLALRVAADLSGGFRDGAWVVELAAVEDPALVPQTVAVALGLRDRTARSAVDALTDYLADKRLLLVLDNCEHLLDASARLAETLLAAAPGLRILATSRQRLAVAGEYVQAVHSLPVPDPHEHVSPAVAQQSEAVRLFAERAALVVGDLPLTEANSASVTRLCRRLDGIPLAIEMAAVRLRTLSVDQILERLDDRFRLLTRGPRTALPRQQTLQATLDWSFELCSAAERAAWGRLSVFFGTFSLAAAEEVCAGDEIALEEVPGVLAALADKSILVREEHNASPRYRLLETVRQYGRALLAGTDEEPLVRRRHRDHYRRLVQRAEAAWLGPHQVDTLIELDLERANLRGALLYSLTEPGEAQVALEISADLWGFWISTGGVSESRDWLRQALLAAPEPTSARAKALWVDAWFAILQGMKEEATPRLRECADLAAALGDVRAMARVRHISAAAEMFTGDYEGALPLLEEGLDLSLAHGEVNTEWYIRYYLALAAVLKGDDRAAALCAECLGLADFRQAQWCRSHALSVSGLERSQQGDVNRAADMLRTAIELKWPLNDQYGIAVCLEVLAWTTAEARLHRDAACLLGSALTMARVGGNPGAQLTPLAEGHERYAARLREVLGDEEFAAMFDAGARFSPEQAVEHALHVGVGSRHRTRAVEHGRPQAVGHEHGPAEQGPATPPRRPGAGPLTQRELEIARLIAERLSNREIADTLVISTRTAEGHIQHILKKLGFTSRTEIAAWVTAQRP
ncbi:LuxR C-terminal-related transcriptional regulator [Nonomuraea lactucae]|uniref:LuxR C-terminal-related transcriptional regulator n=1 Tax=Nonomuraea lactucae TaxID=2249762 RepID=UPI000DE49E0A|nr:LuxR C-terminal-related transcriptional regulator [Nonomuraea lactucae]